MYNDPNQPPQPPPGTQWGSPPPQPPYDQPQPQWNQQPPTQYVPPPPYGQPQPQWDQLPPTQYVAPPPYAAQQYGAPPNYPNYAPPPQPQNYAPPQQPPKKSLRWLWVTLGIIGGIVLLGCAGCGILGIAGVNLFKTALVPTVTASSYYQAVEQQDYTKAYSYLESNRATTSGVPLTQAVYTTQAQGLATAEGAITSYSIGAPDVTNDTAKITVTVTRGSTTYDVHLELTQVNGDWKISAYDRI